MEAGFIRLCLAENNTQWCCHAVVHKVQTDDPRFATYPDQSHATGFWRLWATKVIG